MLWLGDENIPRPAVAFLRQRGEDVLSIVEHWRGIPDEAVIQLAWEQSRILLSFDRDHGDLIFNRAVSAPRAVVFLRVFPPDPERLQPLLDGQFTVVSDSGIRQRPLPVAP
jgi:predicted nuclease of predicted toxin-antitoxin system